MANWHDRPATAALYLAICLLVFTARLTSGLPTVAGSPCEPVCANAGDLVEDVVCLDADYQNLENGRAFQKCVSCQLNSTAVDTEKNETDVEYGLCMLWENDDTAILLTLLRIIQWPSGIRWRDACLQYLSHIYQLAVLVK